MQVNRDDKVVYKEPTNDLARAIVASDCIKDLKLSIPCLLDSISNTVHKAYKPSPARTVVIDTAGTIAYAGKANPRGINPAGFEPKLKEFLSKRKAGKIAVQKTKGR
jgi:hypothetical protein